MKKKIAATILIMLILVMSITGVVCAKEYPGSNITSNNIHDHVYAERANVSNSYIAVNADNTFSRIENYGDVILVETYDSSFKLKAQGTVQFELSRFGGFYDAGDYYYILFGQDNYGQDNEREVIRIVQYSKDWKRSDSFNIRGANTALPFYGCNTDFSVANGYLYIRCGHLTYKNKRGEYSQSAMTISMNMKTGEIADLQCEAEGSGKGCPENIGATYIDGSQGPLVAVDKMLGSYETVSTFVYKNSSGNGKFQSDCVSANALGSTFALTDTIPEFSVGGMEVSSQNVLIVANTEPSDASSIARNIVVISIPRNQVDSKNVNLSYLTGFAVGDAMSAQTPYIVKVSSDKFCVIWEQKNGYSDMEKVYYIYVDGNGHRLSEINSVDGCLSDCQPVPFNDKIIWYTTNGDKTRLYSISEGESAGKPVPEKKPENTTGSAVYNGVDYSKVYDFSYYCSRYPDIRVLYSNNQAAALEHFVTKGMPEGRQGNADFNLGIYQKNYPSLKEQFGDDRPSYYYHYMTSGYYNGYNAKTEN